MAKVPALAKVHIYGGDINESFWVSIDKHDEMYSISFIYPGMGWRIPKACVCSYEVKEEVMRLLGKLHEEDDIEQTNVTWLYDPMGLLNVEV